ncbi:MAG: Flp pilus assembly complex ATPase component TadA [Lentisphaerae bacterium]|nr:Flp pilus assembly complex ATPase component TadA [Lentisphaerota bacterium]
MAVLVVDGGEYQGTQVDMGGERLLIGRSIECDVILHDREVSSKHAQMVRRDKACWLQDLGSTNGTLVNGRKIVQQRLASGDEFQIGRYRLTFSETAEALAGQREASLAEVLRSLHTQLIEELNLKQLTATQMADASLRTKAMDVLERLLHQRRKEIPVQFDHAALKKSVIDAALGLGPLEDLLADDTVTEIMVNAPEKIYIERSGKLQLSTQKFLGKTEVLTAIERIVGPIGRRIDESSPMVDARLADGSRVNAIIPPLALDSPTVTIRKFPKRRMNIDNLLAFKALSDPMAAFLRLCAIFSRNTLISGGTGSGKTTLLNIISSFIPDGERIITIEDSAELSLPQDQVVRLETRPPNIEGKGAVTIRDLVRNALRMRPDRIVVGECRGAEALDMLQAMNTGHDGSLTTAHANTPIDAVRRMEAMVLMSGMELPLKAVREMIASAVHIIVQISRFSDGTRKIVSIAEMLPMYEGDIRVQDLFVFNRTGINKEGKVLGNFSATGVIPLFVEELRQGGVEVDMSIFVPQASE